LGVAIDLGPEGVKSCLEASGIAFMHAPRYHPAMKTIRPVRSALKVRCAWTGEVNIYTKALMASLASMIYNLAAWLLI